MKDTEDINWRNDDSEFGFEELSAWRSLDDYPERETIFLDDPEDLEQDFF